VARILLALHLHCGTYYSADRSVSGCWHGGAQAGAPVAPARPGDDLHDILDEVRVVDSRLQGDDGAPWELDKLLLALSAAA
jgi:hypothetical protein